MHFMCKTPLRFPLAFPFPLISIEHDFPNPNEHFERCVQFDNLRYKWGKRKEREQIPKEKSREEQKGMVAH